MNERSHQAGLITGAEFMRFGVKTLIGVILARILVPHQLGSYRQLFLLYSTFSAFLLLGIPHSILYFLPKMANEEERNQYVSRILNLAGILGFVFSISLILFKGLIAKSFNNPELASLLLIYAGYPIFMFATQIFSMVMIAQHRAGQIAKFTIFSVVSDAVLIIGAAFIFRRLVPIVCGVMIAAGLQWVYARIQLSQYRGSHFWDREFLLSQFKYSLPLGLSSLIGMLSMQLDKLVISGFFSPDQFAVFSIGAMELPFITIFTNSVNAVLLPGISGQPDKSHMAEIYRGAVRKNALIILPMAMLFFIFAKPIIVLLYSARYIAAVPYFKIYLLILPLRIATFGIIFMAMGKTRHVLYNSIFTLSANLVLNLILVRIMGMMGAAVATVIVTWLAAIMYVIWMKTNLHLKLRDFFSLLPIVRTTLACLVAGILAYVCMTIITYKVLSQIIALILFTASYLVIGYWLKAILPYDVSTLKSFVLNLKHRIVK